LNIICCDTEEDLRGIQVADFLCQPVTANLDLQHPGTIERETDSQSIIEASKPSSLWVNDEVINSFLLKVLHPNLRSNVTYFFSSFFFSKLLSTVPAGTNDPIYNFSEVRNWGNKLRRSGGISGLRELFVPINHRNVHLLFLGDI
jgi:hypothetical protein